MGRRVRTDGFGALFDEDRLIKQAMRRGDPGDSGHVVIWHRRFTYLSIIDIAAHVGGGPLSISVQF